MKSDVNMATIAAIVLALVVASYFLAEGRWGGPIVVLAASVAAVISAGKTGR
ncbi:hypothetical protein [Corynebacterium mayonis]|uniref:hypothetical protein n=1 Tax=Corynebacterium mayonis TaxID=3062461 RepID=UPI003140B5EB